MAMHYTNEEFREDLEKYLRFKEAKQAKRAEMPRFFKWLCRDPCYEAKTDFVRRLIEEIDSLEDINTTDRTATCPFRHLLQSGLNGKEGFRYADNQLGMSTLHQLLIKKKIILQDERKSYRTISPHS
jgi:hypothetical protein